MDRYWVEVTIVQEVKANSKKEAEAKAYLEIPKIVFEKFRPNIEVSWRGA